MKKTLMLATIGSAFLLAGCVAVPAYEPAYAPPPPPVAYVAPPTVVVQPYLYAHWGHYYRGPYYRYR
jgi:PBP1b-binding outer membrane lipoprotein LpoB